MRASGHPIANFGLRNEVTNRHPCKASPPSDTVSSLETLVRELVAQAGNNKGVGTDESTDGQGQVIIDTEVDGVRCLLTRLERPSTTGLSFSPRESEIARMVAKGYPNKAIAAVLDISPWTVCTHLRRIFAKLHVSSRAAMVAQLISGGILKDIL